MSDEKGLDTLFATHKETDVTVRLYLSALRGDVDDTLDTLKHGLETGAVLAYRFNRPLPHEAKLFAAVYSDPRYQELLKSYGLDKESLANIRFPELTF